MFDYTGIMALPWLEKGYDCICIDSQHKEGTYETSTPGLYKMGLFIDADNVLEQLKHLVWQVDFVFGFPPCTDLAVSGAAHFKKKALANPNFQKDAIALARTVETVGNHFNCPWALENPVSVMSTQWRKWDFNFQPWEYGEYLGDEEHPFWPEYIPPKDAYNKKTCIWMGNGFKIPEKRPTQLVEGNSKAFSQLGGKSMRTKNIRSATPRGFAKAVCEANA